LCRHFEPTTAALSQSFVVHAETIQSLTMPKCKINLARLEVIAPVSARLVRATFRIKCQQTSFELPINLEMKDFDDTEIIQAARDTLHRVFAELSAESKQWKLTPQERKMLSNQNLRWNS
jgi:hypothetical protein